MTAPRLPLVSAIRGVSFNQDSVSLARPGDRALVEHDPANPYDANACRVLVNGELVGHLPAGLALRMVSGPDRAWDGEVDEVITGNHPTALRIRITAARHARIETTERKPIVPEPDAAQQRQAAIARSGRQLGMLAGQTDTHYLVDTGTNVVPYPRSLVLLEPASAAT